jgi:hypothetical protein
VRSIACLEFGALLSDRGGGLTWVAEGIRAIGRKGFKGSD